MDLPILIDYQDFSTINNLNKSWKANKYGFVSCSHTCDDEIKEVYMHEIVMALNIRDQHGKRQEKPIVHINRIGLDNRRDNLIYDECLKVHKKNIKKKIRSTELPVDSNINPDDIPTYVWYMKPNGSHGDRFMVEIGGVNWKTTSSKKLSLAYKLEEAKAYLRQFKKNNPDLFTSYSMNGDYTKEGQDLINSYYTIVQKAGYEHIHREILENKTDTLLKPGKMTKKEKDLLKSQSASLNSSSKKRRVITSLPKNCGVLPNDVPKHCYYRRSFNGRGGHFLVKGHPKQTKPVWYSTSSIKKTVLEKFDQLKDYLAGLEEVG